MVLKIFAFNRNVESKTGMCCFPHVHIPHMHIPHEHIPHMHRNVRVRDVCMCVCVCVHAFAAIARST